jgi:hypothetical protein
MPDLPQHTKESKEPKDKTKSYSTNMRRSFFKEVSKSSTLNGTKVPKAASETKIADLDEIKALVKEPETKIADLDEIKALDSMEKEKIRPYMTYYQREIKEDDGSVVPKFLISLAIVFVIVSLFLDNNNVENSNSILFTFLYFIIVFVAYFVSIFIYNLFVFSFNILLSFFLKEDVNRNIINNLVTIIWLAEGNHKSLSKTEKRKQQIFLLEKTAKSIENDLPRTLRGGDYATDAWVKETMRQVAAALREKKKSLLIPNKVTSNSIIKSLSSTLIHIADGNWGDLEKIEPAKLTRSELKQSTLKFIKNLLRGIFLGAIPLISLLLLQQTQFALQGAIFTSTVTILIIYEISVFTSIFDPNFGDRISRVKDIKDLLPSPETSSNH